MGTMGDALAIATTQAEMSSFFIDKMGIYNVLSYAAGAIINDGATDAYTALYNCSAVADDNGGIIFFPVGTYKIGSNITFPTNVTLWFADGAKFSPDTGVTVTINGCIMAEMHQIFTGAGTIAGNPKIDVIYPEWFGATGDGATNDTAAIQKAIDLAESVQGTKIFFRDTTYIADSLTVTQPCTLEGAGRNAAVLQASSTTATMLTLSAGTIKVCDILLRRLTGTPTAGSGIVIDSGAFATIERVQVDGFYNGVTVNSATSWSIKNSYIVNSYNYSVYARNTVLGDAGDQVIEGCTIDSNNSPISAIRHESGGGLKIYGNKIIQHRYGYDLQVADGVVTSITLITGNSMESQSHNYIRLGRLGTTGTYEQIVITGNQHAGGVATDKKGYSIGAGISIVTINGNSLSGAADATAIDIAGGTKINIGGNEFNTWNVGVNIASAVTALKILPNAYESVTKTISDATDNTNTDAPVINHYYKRRVNVSSTVTYTNYYKLDLGQYRGCAIDVLVEGILQGVGSVNRVMRYYIARDSGACGVTTISDTNIGQVFDIQLDTTTTSGSVYIGVKRNATPGGTAITGTITLNVVGHVSGLTFS